MIVSVSTNELGSSPKIKDPFMAKALMIPKISLKLAKVTSGSPFMVASRNYHSVKT